MTVSVHAATDTASCPLDWRLFLPRSWDDVYSDTDEEAEQVRRRRSRAQIPDDIRHRPKWQLVLAMLDELADWDLRPPAVIADAGYGDNGLFRTGLTQRGIRYVVAAKSDTSVHPVDADVEEPVYSGRGRPRKRGYLTGPVQARTLVMNLSAGRVRTVSWRQGTKATMTSRFTAVRVRPANRNLPREADGSLSACWLLAEWPHGAAEPTDYWLSTLDEDTPLEQLGRWAKIRWRIEHDYRELKHGLGLDHFEGRTWLGWHHHVTLVTAAHLFITEQRVAGDVDPKAPEAG